jgi:hypothetical protein
MIWGWLMDEKTKDLLWSIRSKVAELENIFANDKDLMRADNFYKVHREALNKLDKVLESK